MINDSDNGSGPLAPDHYTGIESTFSNVHELATHKHNVLYKAMRYGRWYLLKGIAPRYAADEAHHQMLAKEFATMMKLQHPSIVQATSMEDVPTVGACIVMDYIEGKTLEQWLDSSPSDKECREIFMQILDVVAYIHQQGIVHRDLKPSNIMISRVGNQVKIIDFGFADADSDAIFKHAAGTQGYISPEQAAGGEPDVRNDIYSLGAILEKMIPPMSTRYRKITNCCKGTIDNRYSNVAQLRDAMSHADNIARWTHIAAAIVMIAALAVALFFLIDYHKSSPPPQEPQQPSTVIVESTSNETDKLPEEIKDTQATDPPLAKPTPTPIDDRQQAIDQAISEGERKLKAIFPSKELKQNLDTLSDTQYLNLDLIYDGLQFINSYTQSLKPRFSDSEISVIYNRLTITNSAILDDINKRLDRIK